MKMVCKKPNTYGGKKRAFGDELEVSPHDVRLVKALGWFVPFEARPAPRPLKASPKIQSRAMTLSTERVPLPPEDPPPAIQPYPAWVGASARSDATEADADKPKLAYHRRDLRAET